MFPSRFCFLYVALTDTETWEKNQKKNQTAEGQIFFVNLSFAIFKKKILSNTNKTHTKKGLHPSKM